MAISKRTVVFFLFIENFGSLFRPLNIDETYCSLLLYSDIISKNWFYVKVFTGRNESRERHVYALELKRCLCSSPVAVLPCSLSLSK